MSAASVDPGSADVEERLAPLVAALRAVDPERADILARFALAACRRAPQEVVDDLLADVRAGAHRLVGSFSFIDRRTPSRLALRVFTPDAEEHGWSADGAVVEVNVEDSPFLYSTVVEELARLGLEPVEALHPVLGVERGDDGRVRRLLPARQARTRESFMHLRLAVTLDESARAEAEDSLRRVLGDARAATRDFPAMRRRVSEVAERITRATASGHGQEEADEAAAFLRWLLDDHFILLGYREYALLGEGAERAVVVRPGSGLGLLADERSSAYAQPVPLSAIPEALRKRLLHGDLLTVARTNRRSTVHRQMRMIYVGVKRVDDGGIVGEDRLIGLFAQKAYAEPASTTPVLRRKLRQILEREDVVEHSHDERALRVLFDALPKHELFGADADELRASLVSLLEAQRRQDVRLLVRADARQQTVSVLVSVPRERFNPDLRRRVQGVLAARLASESVDYHLSMAEHGQALMHFFFHVDRADADDVQGAELEREVIALTRTWDDELRDALVREHGAAEGARLARRWLPCLPAGYRSATDARAAVADIAELEAQLAGDEPVRMALQETAGPDGAPALRFKLYRQGAGVELSSFVPLVESFGFVVVEEVPHTVVVDRASGPGSVHVHDFRVRMAGGPDIDARVDGPRVAAAALATWHGRAESDSLNRLVAVAGLDWRQVTVLRAYRRYQRQLGTAFTEAYQNEALVQHADVARALVRLFAVRLDPHSDGSAPALRAAGEGLADALHAVERLDQDRILRRFAGMVGATVRTNHYLTAGDARGSGALALKIDSAAVPDMPKPVPHVEVFVYGTEFEGIHLRGGPVARGGIRWSDRREDFRGEVLGLMKAQMVKNAVIVPTGSKGGFVLKGESAATAAQVRRAYQSYIRALLDVTDNVVGDDTVPPPGVRRRDGDDPYLVVAADRGTATLSDVANAIAEEYGFWLGDAFASGGSRGYDHKAMGITARGAWVAVQRHFRELGVDVDAEAVSVVGIGDMSGDVFGNGLLRSRTVRLVAAFDHRDVFVDPAPDPELSYQERARLYARPGSTWQDYDRGRLSAGGGVWSRSAKSIPLSPQARAVLRVDADELTPPEVIKAMLRAPVDLLFAAGVGTFVKASTEAHADVGDRVNDAVRVDAGELGARVVGEGGNLALTQRARIQYARRGGRCNTDAIDNSAGVDTSDREVNLKILLRLAIEEGLLDPNERDGLLAAMTGDVAAGVLRDVYLQTWAISEETLHSPERMDAYERLMADLEGDWAGAEAGATAAASRPPTRLDRTVEVLPDPDEMQRRRDEGAGLTRPELAVLLAYAKVALRAGLVASPLVEQECVTAILGEYFPPQAVERFGALFVRHRLRRELVATLVANDVVNRMGITYVARTAHEFGCAVGEVAAAYWAAREVTGADGHWRAVEALDGEVDPGLQLELKAEIDRLVDAFVRAYVQQGVDDIEAVVLRDQPACEELGKVATALAPLARRRARAARSARYTDLGVDDELADRLAALDELAIVPDVASVARLADTSVRQAAEVFFRLGEVLPFDLLNERLAAVQPAGQWEQWLQRGLLDDVREIRREAASRILRDAGDAPPTAALERFLAARGAGRQRLSSTIVLLDRDDPPGLSGIAVAVRSLRSALR